MKLILLGPPGAGKGTHAKTLSDRYMIPHISTGDIFRMNIKNQTELGKIAQGYIAKGQLVPDELTVDLVLNRLEQPDCKDGYILDGFPRNLVQAESLTKALEAKTDDIDFALHLMVEDSSIVRRMAGRRVCTGCGASYNVDSFPTRVEGICDRCGKPVVQRDDDKAETVLDRLVVYHRQTEPIAEYYRNRGKEIQINGDRPIAQVAADLISSLGENHGSNDQN